MVEGFVAVERNKFLSSNGFLVERLMAANTGHIPHLLSVIKWLYNKPVDNNPMRLSLVIPI